MSRKIKQVDLSKLIDEDDINRTNIKNEMRKIWPAIHQKLTDGGWMARDMVRWLGEHGVEMSVELFRVYLRDLDKEQGYVRSTKEFNGTGKSRRSGDSSRETTTDLPHVPIKPVEAEKKNQVVKPVAAETAAKPKITVLKTEAESGGVFENQEKRAKAAKELISTRTSRINKS